MSDAQESVGGGVGGESTSIQTLHADVHGVFGPPWPGGSEVFSPLCDARREARRADVNFDSDRVNYS